jgi:hypothetical protein
MLKMLPASIRLTLMTAGPVIVMLLAAAPRIGRG